MKLPDIACGVWFEKQPVITVDEWTFVEYFQPIRLLFPLKSLSVHIDERLLFRERVACPCIKTAYLV